jgi:hypothetical protein
VHTGNAARRKKLLDQAVVHVAGISFAQFAGNSVRFFRTWIDGANAHACVSFGGKASPDKPIFD